MPKKQSWGFDLSNLDASVRPQDDFFQHISGGWIKNNPIPENESRWGIFWELLVTVDTQIYKILVSLKKKQDVQPGSDEQMLRDFYLSGMDMKKRNTLGIRPLEALLSQIEKASSVQELFSLTAALHRIDVGVLWNAYIDQDAKNTTIYRLHLAQGGLGMPDRDYYLKKTPEFLRVRTAYALHIEKIFILAGYTKTEASLAAESVLTIEKKLAQSSMSKEDRRDIEKTYHKTRLSSLKKSSPSIAWDEYFSKLGVKHDDVFMVEQPLFFSGVAKMLTNVPLSQWQQYYAFHVVNSFAPALSLPFTEQQFSFYQKALNGAKEMKPLWRLVLAAMNSSIGELLGKEYVERHFPSAAKEKAVRMVKDLCAAYRERILQLEWMSQATKKKALQKLARMNAKIGYPEKWESYKGLVIHTDTYVENIMRASEFNHVKEMKKLGKPVNRKEWFMLPQTVNAYFADSLNDIVFPAAILQPPLFSLTADDAFNYGSMGSVIGHELTHGFDDEGSKRDEQGNVKNWWTKSDKKKFAAQSALLTKQYNAYTVADGVHVSGALTLGENIADLGGVIIAFNAYQKQLARTGRKIIDGYTPEQRFFMGFAVFEAGHTRPEKEKTAALTDPHSPAQFRVNGVVTNVDAFYETYGLTPKDALFKPAAKRIRIW